MLCTPGSGDHRHCQRATTPSEFNKVCRFEIASAAHALAFGQIWVDQKQIRFAKTTLTREVESMTPEAAWEYAAVLQDDLHPHRPFNAPRPQARQLTTKLVNRFLSSCQVRFEELMDNPLVDLIPRKNSPHPILEKLYSDAVNRIKVCRSWRGSEELNFDPKFFVDNPVVIITDGESYRDMTDEIRREVQVPGAVRHSHFNVTQTLRDIQDRVIYVSPSVAVVVVVASVSNFDNRLVDKVNNAFKEYASAQGAHFRVELWVRIAVQFYPDLRETLQERASRFPYMACFCFSEREDHGEVYDRQLSVLTRRVKVLVERIRSARERIASEKALEDEVFWDDTDQPDD
uniref:Uncharacterized protein n=2 Tax=Bursaphelenchus xylophilus TaxID=6326 RepID=A0A1I7SDZ4_BURXY